MSKFVDLLHQLSQAMAPSPGRPQPADFEHLLDRLEREFTIAYSSCVWRSTWAELLELSERLFADKGDLAEFYAWDHASVLVLSRGIEGFNDDFPRNVKVNGAVRTLASLAQDYIRLADPADSGHWLVPTVFGYLFSVVVAYSPPAVSSIEVAERVLEVLRRTGFRPGPDDYAVSQLKKLRYQERRERYEREKTGARPGSDVAIPRDAFDERS